MKRTRVSARTPLFNKKIFFYAYQEYEINNDEGGAMITGFGHVGIYVNNLDQVLEAYERIFGLKPKVVKTTASSRIAFIPVGTGELELIQPLDPTVIATHGEGIRHLALITDNIEAEIERIQGLGVAIDESPRMGAHEVKIAFTHDIHGVSIELCQEPGQRIY